jgi:hypothetical protein
MSGVLGADVLQDEIAVSLARVVASANRRAREMGVDVPQSIISISQHSLSGGRAPSAGWSWRVNYVPKEYVGRRGGDLIVDVDPSDSSIKQVLWGQ